MNLIGGAIFIFSLFAVIFGSVFFALVATYNIPIAGFGVAWAAIKGIEISGLKALATVVQMAMAGLLISVGILCVQKVSNAFGVYQENKEIERENKEIEQENDEIAKENEKLISQEKASIQKKSFDNIKDTSKSVKPFDRLISSSSKTQNEKERND